MTTQTRSAPALAIMVKRHPLIAFFVLAYALTWWVYPLLRFSPLIGLLGLFGPALAAIVVTAVTDGRRGVTALLKRAVRWRVPAALVPRRPRPARSPSAAGRRTLRPASGPEPRSSWADCPHWTSCSSS